MLKSKRRRLPVRWGGLLLAWVVLAGCATTVLHPYDSRRTEVLDQYFTEEAAAVLARVPLRVGRLPNAAGFAVGDDAGSRLLSMVSGYGNHRQVIINRDSPADDLLILHEYVHQAEYLGLIDKGFFRERYAILREDIHFRDIAETWESRIVRYHSAGGYGLVALAYNRGMERELIPYLIQGWIEGRYELPEYMLEVYLGTIRMDARERR